MAAPKVKAPKIKVHWRGTDEGVKHAVRQVDDLNLDKAVCGAAVQSNWSAPGTRAKKADRRCAKCAKWEPLGMGPGGPNYKAPKRAAGTEVRAEAVSA
jgi:hypothetical protein